MLIFKRRYKQELNMAFARGVEYGRSLDKEKDKDMAINAQRNNYGLSPLISAIENYRG